MQYKPTFDELMSANWLIVLPVAGLLLIAKAALSFLRFMAGGKKPSKGSL